MQANLVTHGSIVIIFVLRLQITYCCYKISAQIRRPDNGREGGVGMVTMSHSEWIETVLASLLAMIKQLELARPKYFWE